MRKKWLLTLMALLLALSPLPAMAEQTEPDPPRILVDGQPLYPDIPPQIEPETLPDTVQPGDALTLELYTESAKDGSIEDLIEIPLEMDESPAL